MSWAVEVTVACPGGQRATRQIGTVKTQIRLLNLRERRGVSTGFGI